MYLFVLEISLVLESRHTDRQKYIILQNYFSDISEPEKQKIKIKMKNFYGYPAGLAGVPSKDPMSVTKLFFWSNSLVSAFSVFLP